MKKFLLLTIILGTLAPNFFVLAQNIDLPDDNITDKEKINEAIISSEDFVGQGKKLILDASNSIYDKDIGPVVFRWEFGDGYFETGEQVVHQYSQVGSYNINLQMTQGDSVVTQNKEIFVFDRKALLFTDENKDKELNLIKNQAIDNGVALQILSILSEDGSFVAEDRLLQEINEFSDYIMDSDLLLFYTDSSAAIQTFSRFFQILSDNNKKIVANKFFVILTDGNFEITSNFAYQAFKIIKPDYILLTRPEALSVLFSEENTKGVPDKLHARGVETLLVDEKEEKFSFFVLSNLTTWLLSRGVTPSTIYLILIIPLLSFIVIFFRHVVGLSTFGVYTPVMIVASFFILGINLGLTTFLVAVITSYGVKRIINKFDLLYLPKVALNLSVVSLSFLLVILLAIVLDFKVSFSLAIFPMLVMSNVAEKFMAAQTEEGLKGALFGVLETLIVVLLSFYFITWTTVNNAIMSWPEWVFLPMILSLFLGKFTGLRLSEYFRFRSLFSDHAEE